MRIVYAEKYYNETFNQTKPMKTNTLYRVDNYRNQSGSLVGFYNTLDDAMLEIDGTPVGEDFDQSGRYYQLTTFTSPDDMPTMQAWTNELAEIQSTEYFD